MTFSSPKFKRNGPAVLRIAYATPIPAVRHIVPSLLSISKHLTIYMPWVPSENLIKVIALFSKRLSLILSSRFREQIESDVTFRKLRPTQFLIPLLRLMGFRHLSTREIEKIQSSYIDLKRISINNEILVAVEELIPSKRARFSNILICEARDYVHLNLKSIRPEPLMNYPISEPSPINEISRMERLAQADAIITYSKFAAETFVNAGWNPKRVGCAPLSTPPIFPNIHSLSNRKEGALYVGRGALHKGLDIAVALSIESGIPLTVIGNFNSDVHSWLRNFQNVTCRGSQPRKVVLSEMAHLKYFFATSIESYGYAALEALQSGMQVIGTKNVGALSWVSESNQLFLAEGLNVEALLLSLKFAIRTNLESKSNFDFLKETEVNEIWTSEIRKLIDVVSSID